MPQNTTNLHIATTADRWTEIKSQVEHAIANLCSEPANAERLLLLVDWMTNERYDAIDRNMVISDVMQHAFLHTEECESAITSFMDRISPDRRRQLREVKRA